MPPSSPPTHSFPGVSRMETTAKISVNSKASGPASLTPLQRTFQLMRALQLQSGSKTHGKELGSEGLFFPHSILGNFRQLMFQGHH